MTSKLKTVGTALVVALASTALLASAALAQFESESQSPTLTVGSNSSQNFKLSATSEQVLTCETVAYDSAFLEGTVATSWTVEPTYANCLGFLGQSTSFDMNGCDYVFHLADNATEATTDIECPTSTGILLTVGGLCTYEFDSQAGLGTVTVSTLGTSSTRVVGLAGSITGMTSTRTTKHSFICPPASSSGVYAGNTTVTGSSGGGHVGVFVD
jgi:hypothetical protein